MLEREELEKPLGAHAGPAGEEFLEPEFAHPCHSGEFVQRGLAVEILLEVPESLFDGVIVG